METLSTKEAFVSFDVARLLKEKGFDWGCCSYWCVFPNGDIVHTKYGHFANHNGNETDRFVSRPTQAMACRWLREEYNIFVTVQPCEVGAGVMDYTYCIYRIHGDNYYFEPLAQGRITEAIYYEKTIEAGLEYVLKNLI